LVLKFESTKTDTQTFLRLYELFESRPEEIAKNYLSTFSKGKSIWGMSLSNQRYNQLLKDIGGIAGISTPLTAHLSRHTFGTHRAKQTGNLLITMAEMGIKSFTTAKTYINLAHQLD
jgi:site-specific recombinase XerD